MAGRISSLKTFLRLVILSHFILFACNMLSGQMVLHTPQNTLLPGESIQYSIVYSKVTFQKDDLPVTHLVLYDKNGIEIFRESFKPKSHVFTNHLDIPITIKPGSYVLTASIHDEFNYEVLVEHSQVVHILGAQEEAYFVFNNTNTESFDTSDQIYKTALGMADQVVRSEICSDVNIPEGLVSVANKKDSYFPSFLLFSSEKTNHQKVYKERFDLETKDERTWLALYDPERRRVLIPDINEKNGEFILSLISHPNRVDYQPINAYSAENINKVIRLYPKPKWKENGLVKLEQSDDEMLRIREKRQIRYRANQIFHSVDLSESKVQMKTRSDIPVADKIIEFENYERFESIELFIKEAITSVKLVKAKGEKQLILVNGDKRGFFSGPPLLIIDNRIETNINALLKIPYEEFVKLEIYRTQEKLNPMFSLLGNYGVLIVETKSNIEKAKLGVSIKGHLKNEKFFNLSPSESSDTRSYLSGIQSLGWHQGGKFCYDHNDELGLFRLTHLGFDESNSSSFQDFKVSIGNGQQ